MFDVKFSLSFHHSRKTYLAEVVATLPFVPFVGMFFGNTQMFPIGQVYWTGGNKFTASLIPWFKGDELFGDPVDLPTIKELLKGLLEPASPHSNFQSPRHWSITEVTEVTD